MAKKPLCVAILWHMHQPDYGNVQTGEIYLPWTRFHAIKDYYDMGALVAETGLHVTFNVVPVLMDQLRAYGGGTVRETYIALTLRDAAELEARERSFLLRSFFQLQWKQMVQPYPRYKELLHRRGVADEQGEYAAGLMHYNTQDYRDLQVWFNLSWCGEELRRNPDIAALIRKGHDFTEDEKRSLIDLQTAFIARILPFYGRLMQEGGIELSVSPYFHPILPLLCDNRSARECLPEIHLPSNPFAFPVDAREHVRLAQERYMTEFGRLPLGMWPAEGSISDATALLARDAGLRWLASDEEVLLNSLRKNRLAGHQLTLPQKLSAYQWGDSIQGPCFFFRDHGLSDLIGFTYSKWNSEDAAANFLNRLRGIHNALPDDGHHYVVPVILDGENAWEHYPANWAPFLRLLYRGLADDKQLRAVTFSEFLELETRREPLPSIASGSWIGGNFATWIGHHEKNRAWDFLAAARNNLAARESQGADKDRVRQAYQEVMIAEGSDWFWWYGDDHYSDNAAELDTLFRTHVKNVYRILGEPYPLELDLPIKGADAKIQSRNPMHTISPILDGKVTDYFEWLDAGYATASGGSGSMHRTETLIEKIYFGYEIDHFYLRLDPASKGLPVEACVNIHFVAPRERVLRLERDDKLDWSCRWLGDPEGTPVLGANKILELGFRLESLGFQTSGELGFFVSVLEKDRELERFPPNGFLTIVLDPRGLDQEAWIV